MRRPEFLRDLWYVALRSRDLRRGALVGKTILGEPVVLGRSPSGAPFALRDRCPHRGMPLRHGRLCDGEVECCYHGWRFGVEDGVCRLIPALAEPEEVRADRIRVPTFPCREEGGRVWIFVPEHGSNGHAEEPPPLPTADAVGALRAKSAGSLVFPCHADWAVIGLTDPAHVTYVHRSWWWGRKKGSRLKEKQFQPVPLGYRMGPHEMAQRPLPYRLLGRRVEVEIHFLLPGIRIEVIRGDRHSAVSVTSVTPLTESACEVHHAIYSTRPRMWWAALLGGRLIRTFLGQDQDFARRQVEGVAHDKGLTLVGDADQEARWYFALKQEYLESRAEEREFRNPVEARVLRWRS
jgi:phenylpropionate dioxygenase-like ring-hydroxylating dioxygenase large terminal subunit